MIRECERDRQSTTIDADAARELVKRLRDLGYNATTNIGSAAALIEKLVEEKSQLEAECSAFAADQCHHGYIDEYGNHRCKYHDEIARFRSAPDRNAVLEEAARVADAFPEHPPFGVDYTAFGTDGASQERSKKSIAEAIRALKSAEPTAAQDGWQPIESAPKNSLVEIILAGQLISGNWEVRSGSWLVKRWPYVGQGQPTHWRPLPSPPHEPEGDKP